MSITTLPKLYTEDEACAYLGLSAVTMRRLRADRRIAFIASGRRVRYTEKHLTDYLESQTCHASSSPTSTPSSSGKGRTTGISNPFARAPGPLDGEKFSLWLEDAEHICELHNASLESESTISELRARITALEAEKAERERQEPVAWAWDDALGCMHAHCGSKRPVWVDGECSDAKRAETSLRPLYAAPPIPRVEQEPVAWVLFDDIFIAPKDMQDDPPNLECMKPLYAHPLALREPTEEECREIWRAIRRTTATDQISGGRAIWQAVREVMTK